MFLHGSFIHLLLTGFALALFASILENMIGSRRFLLLYFSAGLVASIFSSFFYSASLGASGAIYGVLGTLTVLQPFMTVWVSYIPMPMWVAAIVWASQDILGIFIPDNIANFAHLSGLGFGLVFGFFIRARRPQKEKKKKDIIITKEELENWENNVFKI